MKFWLVLAAGWAILASEPASAAKVTISIDKTSQMMTVAVDGQQQYAWPVSTGVPKYATPSGTYTPFRLEEFHFSEEWDLAPMPHSIFFTRTGHAIHGTDQLDKLGSRASHGCVRLDPDNAAALFALVQEAGLPNTTVVVRGTPAPNLTVAAKSREVKKKVAARAKSAKPAKQIKAVVAVNEPARLTLPKKRELWPYERAN